jgi:hypothetical protein
MNILSAELTNGSVLVVFGDGVTAFYSAEMLYSCLPEMKGSIDGPGPKELIENEESIR